MTTIDPSLKQVLSLLTSLNRQLGPTHRRPRRPPAPAGMRYVTEAEYHKIQADKKAAALAASTQNADAALRAEVVEQLTSEGIAPHVAANLTNTTAKMLEQARKCGII